jgi:hypothetical protein
VLTISSWSLSVFEQLPTITAMHAKLLSDVKDANISYFINPDATNRLLIP